MATGNYPGKARTPDELRSDLEKAYRLVPGQYRLNLHAIYAETGGRKVERDELTFDHFRNWTAWARGIGIGMDFNPTFFAHPKAASGWTLSHPDPAIREFWIGHGRACRRIGAQIGRVLGTPCVTNVWIPDGSKDMPADRKSPRLRLEESLDRMFAEKLSAKQNLDAVESKLFGIGSECYVAGSHEFYLAYAVARGTVPCLDMGHFHPTETVHDKLSAVLSFADRLLLHVSRPIRWDSDHVVILNDDLRNVFHELVRGEALDRVFVALDYFDASINRVAAYVIGARATRKALLCALLEPSGTLRELERSGRNAQKLALMEEMKTMPQGAVWDMLCARQDVPVGASWLAEIERYEAEVLSGRK